MLACGAVAITAPPKHLRRGPRKKAQADVSAPFNEGIRAPEVRLITEDGENLGTLTRSGALARARERGLDLVLISPNANPPVAKITDYGRHKYELKKRQQAARAKAHTTETKNVQVKIGTGEHDLMLKARRASEWLAEGHRVKVELYLRGRARYLDRTFLEDRLERFLKLLSHAYTIAEPIGKDPKGLAMIIERK